MPDLVRPTGRVYWLGTGMSTGSGLALVCEATSTMVCGRTLDKAEACLARLGLRGRAQTSAFDAESLAQDLEAGDVVVSMLPASEHAGLVQLAVERGAHFVCSSYLSPEVASRGAAAAGRGSVVLTETGLDPGIDHLLAHELVRKAQAVTGDEPAIAHFTSYCGSNPAVPNEFRYRFSWAPRGVLAALSTPARVIEDGCEKRIERPWEAVKERVVGAETFEVYPNRDSIPFVTTYALPSSWKVETFVRGTLRLDGWSHAWRDVFGELPHATDARVSQLAAELAARHPVTSADRDRVVMSVRLDVLTDADEMWCGEYSLDVIGDSTESATPRLVSVPLSCGVLDVVAGRIAPGLHQAAEDPAAVARWLRFLDCHGISPVFRPGAPHQTASSALS